MDSRISNTNNDSNQEGEEETPEDRARCEWDFHLASIISPSTTREVSDVIGAIQFDPTGHLLATGGISRKIRIYALSSLVSPHGYDIPTTNFSDHSTTCKFYICTPAKLSSLRWRPNSGGRIIGSGDYDGVVTEYDVERRLAIFERDEHDGRRVWSIDYSIDGELGVSGSDDGTALIWDRRCNGGGGGVWAAKAGGAVCGVEFDPGGGPWIGVGSADRHAYVYDIRAAAAAGPVALLGGHGRAVTYVRFATAGGGGRVVTSGTDGTHRLWSWEEGREERVYRGHVNKRSFVGLSVWREGGLLGSGSESGEVFVYDLRWGEPIWVNRWAGDRDDADRSFVSAVSWRQTAGEREGMLVAGGSDGVLRAFVSKRKAGYD
ncbi:WD repeat-containing protein RUP2 [Cocos nucifera]|uniref:WD repeat-containing protein RUP2 n=1 Tax=Cocos nucifera TaxID=13894 RepID=A0A8K0IJX1_COCNU|nr:WD repeat-containing protein RUP2 [Cocos nucifera]